MDWRLRAEIYIKQNGGDTNNALKKITKLLKSFKGKNLDSNNNLRLSYEFVKNTSNEIVKIQKKESA